MDKQTTAYLKGRRVLVTGGTGSIGRIIVQKTLEAGAAHVSILSVDTTRSDQLKHELSQHFDQSRFTCHLGSITNRKFVEQAILGVEVVFHAAAQKYVPHCEENPLMAVETNVTGTYNVIAEAIHTPTVERVVIVSTDKAVSSTTVMGATKLIGERMAIQHSRAVRNSSKSKPIICSVRFGNVAGSVGSVIGFFAKQASNGQVMTVTHEAMTRFMMTIPQAVDLVLSAGSDAKGGEVYVLKMGCLKITDLARVMYNTMYDKADENPLQTKIIGIRPGEKLHEELVTPEELMRTIEMDYMYKVIPDYVVEEYQDEITASDLYNKFNSHKDDYNGISSRIETKMTDEEILELLRQPGVLKDMVI